MIRILLECILVAFCIRDRLMCTGHKQPAKLVLTPLYSRSSDVNRLSNSRWSWFPRFELITLNTRSNRRKMKLTYAAALRLMFVPIDHRTWRQRQFYTYSLVYMMFCITCKNILSSHPNIFCHQSQIILPRTPKIICYAISQTFFVSPQKNT